MYSFQAAIIRCQLGSGRSAGGDPNSADEMQNHGELTATLTLCVLVTA